MKKGIHPENYRPVVFKDMSNGDMFLTKSTCKTNDTVEFEGETYPVVEIGLARGKKLYDKREAIAKKDQRREAEKEFKVRNL